jgi:DnaB-like helicase C terminal domain
MSNLHVTPSDPPCATPAIVEFNQAAGLIEQVLAGTQCAAAQSQGTKELHDTIRRALEIKRERRSGQYMYIAQSPDAVFEYVLDHCLGQGDATNIPPRAWNEYLNRKTDYDLVLSELIPSYLRDRAAFELQYRNYETGRNPTALEDWPVFMHRLGQRREQSRGSAGITTGFDAVDSALGGGLRGINFLGGVAGSGKSSLSMQIVLAALKGDPEIAALVLTPDMYRDEWLIRLICHEAGVARKTIESREIPSDVVCRIRDAIERLRSQTLGRVRFADKNSFEGESLSEALRSTIRDFLEHTRAARLLIVLDYFQLLAIPSGTGEEDPDRYRIDLLSRLQRFGETLADPTGATILAVSEVRKEASGGTSLRTKDLLGSTRLSYSANSVLLLQTPEDDLGHGDVVPRILKISKSRDGSTCHAIALQFEHRLYRFSDSRTVAAPQNKRPSFHVNALAGANSRKPV